MAQKSRKGEDGSEIDYTRLSDMTIASMCWGPFYYYWYKYRDRYLKFTVLKAFADYASWPFQHAAFLTIYDYIHRRNRAQFFLSLKPSIYYVIYGAWNEN